MKKLIASLLMIAFVCTLTIGCAQPTAKKTDDKPANGDGKKKPAE